MCCWWTVKTSAFLLPWWSQILWRWWNLCKCWTATADCQEVRHWFHTQHAGTPHQYYCSLGTKHSLTDHDNSSVYWTHQALSTLLHQYAPTHRHAAIIYTHHTLRHAAIIYTHHTLRHAAIIYTHHTDNCSMREHLTNM